MTAPTPQQTAAGIAAVAAIFAGIVAGTIYVQHDSNLHARVDFDGAPPADTACARIVAVGPSAAWSALGLDTSEPDYATGYVCAPPTSEPAGELPGGVRVIETELVPYVAGMGRLEIWSSRHADAPKSGCACSTGADCERLVRSIDGAEEWKPAGKPSLMNPGEWRGSGCIEVASCHDVTELRERTGRVDNNLAPACRSD